MKINDNQNEWVLSEEELNTPMEFDEFYDNWKLLKERGFKLSFGEWASRYYDSMGTKEEFYKNIK